MKMELKDDEDEDEDEEVMKKYTLGSSQDRQQRAHNIQMDLSYHRALEVDWEQKWKDKYGQTEEMDQKRTTER